MKVLGIDPGYGRCGMAIVEREGGKDRLLFSDCVETKTGDEFAGRLFEIIERCAKLIKQHQPDCLAIEKLYFSSNQKTAMRVSEARGALIECATEHGIAVFEYTPAQIKSATSGSGRADKKQIAAMLHLLIKIEKEIRYDDEYDAIAVAVAHLAFIRIPSPVG
ncbi:MAG TPA: crossover junction endodeoxyribonuclease RuvC [Candidatus Paceibacterota bacterium]|jgi:crossover junction endodeoxyribonuclease RuvC|nr:crossover junction endodeoxyribonuclease RuvC [Candidatus Paceibacterota bacterium]